MHRQFTENDRALDLSPREIARLLGPYESAYQRQLQTGPQTSAQTAARRYAIDRRAPLKRPDERLRLALEIAQHPLTLGELCARYNVPRGHVQEWIALITAPLADALELTLMLPEQTLAHLQERLADPLLLDFQTRNRGQRGRFVARRHTDEDRMV
jgi:hypothetical protein